MNNDRIMKTRLFYFIIIVLALNLLMLNIMLSKTVSDSIEDDVEDILLSNSEYTASDLHNDLLDIKPLLLKSSDFATHSPVLLACVKMTHGPVMEMGIGYSSTTILNKYVAKAGRYALSAETDINWLSQWKNVTTKNHKFVYVPVYGDNIGCYDKGDECTKNGSAWSSIGSDRKWSVVLVDHRPGERRIHDIFRLMNNSNLIIAHDTQQETYKWSNVFHLFKNVYTFKAMTPTTTLLATEENTELFNKVASLLNKYQQDYGNSLLRE